MTQYYLTREDELYHHGIKGQKWGERRYQNEDGSLTAEGRQHYGYGEARANMQSAKAKYKADQKAYSKAFNRATGAGQYIRGLTKKGKAENERRYADLVKTANKASKSEAAYKQAKKEYKNSDEYKDRQEKIKKAAKVGAAIVGTALVAYGGYKVIKGISADKKYTKALEYGREYYSNLSSKAFDRRMDNLGYGSNQADRAFKTMVYAHNAEKSGNRVTADQLRDVADMYTKSSKRYYSLADTNGKISKAADKRFLEYARKK